jgi:molecular chaperone HtpG
MTLHYRAEGRQSYAVLLFAPSTKPFDLFDQARKGKVKLYVRRVFIADDADLLPAYLRFIRGVIDSEDLPLNISREMLQNNPQLAQIRKAVTGRVISELESLGEKEPEAFGKIWDAFGLVIKEGIWEDFERREKLLGLSRFTTTKGENRTLKQYVDDLKSNQTDIFYLTGDSVERLKSNPKLESATARGIEVLLLTDPVDAFWTSAPLDFGGKPLKSLSQGDIDFGLIPLLDDKADDQKDEAGADEAMTIALIKDALGDRVSDVRASQRLTASASCLVAGGGAHGCWRCRTRARSPGRSWRSTCATPWSRRLPVTRKRQRICRSCCWNRRKSSTASCLRIQPRSPTGSISWCCAASPRDNKG